MRERYPSPRSGNSRKALSFIRAERAGSGPVGPDRGCRGGWLKRIPANDLAALFCRLLRKAPMRIDPKIP
jgi:hypothetical protein